MKKLSLILLAIFFTGTLLTSCGHTSCAGQTSQKVEKVKVSALPRSI